MSDFEDVEVVRDNLGESEAEKRQVWVVEGSQAYLFRCPHEDPPRFDPVHITDNEASADLFLDQVKQGKALGRKKMNDDRRLWRVVARVEVTVRAEQGSKVSQSLFSALTTDADLEQAADRINERLNLPSHPSG